MILLTIKSRYALPGENKPMIKKNNRFFIFFKDFSIFFDFIFWDITLNSKDKRKDAAQMKYCNIGCDIINEKVADGNLFTVERYLEMLPLYREADIRHIELSALMALS